MKYGGKNFLNTSQTPNKSEPEYQCF